MTNDAESDDVSGEQRGRFRRVGIRSGQTTLLRSRAGHVVGMLSTHWIEPHRPMMHDLASLDVLARQAADVIERRQTERQRAGLQSSLDEERRLVLRLSAPILRLRERLLLLPLIGVIDNERAGLIAGALLEAVRRERARVVIIDVSGLAHLDPVTAVRLVSTIHAALLLGTSVILTGVTERVSPSLTALAADVRNIAIAGDLQEGLDAAFTRIA